MLFKIYADLSAIRGNVRHRTGRIDNMTVRDLYVNTDENQEFIMWFESEPSKACYKGKLEDCPSELMYMLVDKFRAIDFNTIEVILIG